MARRRSLPWRRLAGDGRSRPYGSHFGRDQALEVERDTGNSPRAKAGFGEASGGPHGDGAVRHGGVSRRSRSGRRGGFGSTTSSVRRPGERGGAHRGLEVGLDTTACDRRQRQAAEAVGVRGEGCCRGSPGSWSLRIDAWRSCEGSTGVREVRVPPAAKNCGGGVGYRWRSSARFPHGRARGRGGKTRVASWRDGKAVASLSRGWDAPERPAHDGAEALHDGASGRQR
jgi:hypothetical protein